MFRIISDLVWESVLYFYTIILESKIGRQADVRIYKSVHIIWLDLQALAYAIYELLQAYSSLIIFKILIFQKSEVLRQC